MAIGSRGLIISFGKIKAFYLPHHKACGYQTRQCGDLPPGSPTNSVTNQWPPNVMRWWLKSEGLPPTNSHDPLIMQSCNKLKTLMPLSQCLWSPNLPGL